MDPDGRPFPLRRREAGSHAAVAASASTVAERGDRRARVASSRGASGPPRLPGGGPPVGSIRCNAARNSARSVAAARRSAARSRVVAFEPVVDRPLVRVALAGRAQRDRRRHASGRSGASFGSHSNSLSNAPTASRDAAAAAPRARRRAGRSRCPCRRREAPRSGDPPTAGTAPRAAGARARSSVSISSSCILVIHDSCLGPLDRAQAEPRREVVELGLHGPASSRA